MPPLAQTMAAKLILTKLNDLPIIYYHDDAPHHQNETEVKIYNAEIKMITAHSAVAETLSESGNGVPRSNRWSQCFHSNRGGRLQLLSARARSAVQSRNKPANESHRTYILARPAWREPRASGPCRTRSNIVNTILHTIHIVFFNQI